MRHVNEILEAAKDMDIEGPREATEDMIVVLEESMESDEIRYQDGLIVEVCERAYESILLGLRLMTLPRYRSSIREASKASQRGEEYDPLNILPDDA